jgi:glutamate racemase
LDKGVKAILIACNSASAAAFELVKEYVGSRAMVFNVIDPVSEYLSQHYKGHKIGLIGTKQTVNSGIYARKLEESGSEIQLASLATPLLAPMIEEGFFSRKISTGIIEEYLRNPILEDIRAIVLACTHYPLISNQINDFFQGKVDIVDSSKIVAESIRVCLTEKEMLNSGSGGQKAFFVSDYTQAFENSTQIFFGNRLNLTYFPIWD